MRQKKRRKKKLTKMKKKLTHILLWLCVQRQLKLKLKLKQNIMWRFRTEDISIHFFESEDSVLRYGQG